MPVEPPPIMAETATPSRLAQLYETACRPDRPPGADRDRRPTVAMLLSLALPGAGQLYNRQLFKSLMLFFVVLVVCGVLAAAWLILGQLLPDQGDGWGLAVGRFFLRLGTAAPIVGGGLWLFAVVDAARTAAALRAGRLMVRYTFRKQAAMIAAGFVPWAGLFVPDETCAPGDQAHWSARSAAEQIGMALVMRRFRKLLKLTFALLGLAPLLVGAVVASQFLIVAGSVVVLLGLILTLR